MGWFRKSRRKEEAQAKKTAIWTICSSCKAHIYKEEWKKCANICPKCNFHDKITCKERLNLLIDPDTFEQINAEITTTDPLEFSDNKGSYASKAEATKIKTGMNEAVITGRGKIHGTPVVVAIMDFRFMGGSLGSGTGEKILRASDYALRYKLPYIIVSASGGARMHEGIISLMQMAKTCAGIARLNKAGIPYISVLTHPTTGGVSASYAMVGDVNIAEPGILIGFAGRRVIEQTIKQKLPDDFQTAEYLLEHGFIDIIAERKEMKKLLHNILQYWNKG
ncbi:acetyl-CoA carboxylase, carboxyltransferase subunit beta [Verrucomicrobiota bacterium]